MGLAFDFEDILNASDPLVAAQRRIELQDKIRQLIPQVGTDRKPGRHIGDFKFDTRLGKPIWWTGKKWVDATGAEV